MTILPTANHQTLTSVALVMLLLTPHPYSPIALILCKPLKAIKEHTHSTSETNAFNKSQFFIKSTLEFSDYSSKRAQAVFKLHLPIVSHVPTSVPVIEPFAPKPKHSSSQVDTGIPTSTNFDIRVILYSEAGTSTRSQVRSDKPRAHSSRLLRIIPTIALWIGFTVVVIALLVSGILSVVYGGLPIRPE